MPAAPLKRLAGRTLAGALAGATALMLTAWDTKEEPRGSGGPGSAAQSGHDRSKWMGLYYCDGIPAQACEENEHAWLADTALRRAAPNNPWGFQQDDQLVVYDLNGGYYRPRIGLFRGAPGDEEPVMSIPRRTLPGAGNWASIPDISYTIYDWINKNEYCPPVPGGQMPPDLPADCHNFPYWHGGAFNSSHFGSQATRTYQHLHAVALTLAARAGTLRQNLGDDPANIELHRDAVREAELEALAFEGYAQHFLQDRWALGHMWDRWGAPEYRSGGIALDPAKALIAGGFSGIVHGHQAVTGVPDALSSPEIVDSSFLTNIASYLKASFLNAIGLGPSAGDEIPASEIYVAEWRHQVGSGETHQGVGDYRGRDMMRGDYATYATIAGTTLAINPDRPLNVIIQREEFLNCSAAGFKEVIVAFGGATSSGYGLDGVAVSANVPGAPEFSCFDGWVTNEAMVVAFGPEFATVGALASLARMVVKVGVAISDTINSGVASSNVGGDSAADLLPMEVGNFVYSDRWDALETTRMYAWTKLRAYDDPTGIDVAQGGIGTLMGIPTGDTYSIAGYLEPIAITSLPDEDPRGRDARALFGFFNRAHADYFCRQSGPLLTELRRSLQERDRATCRILAQRVYEGVREDSLAVEEFISAMVNGERMEADPLCKVAAPNWSAPRFDGDRLDEMHPGYVAWDFYNKRSRAFEMDDEGIAYRSIANWCDAVPVVDYVEDEDLADQAVVASIEDTRDTITIAGRNFGEAEGELKIGGNAGSAVTVTQIESWSDTRIRFSVEDVFSQIAFDSSNDAYLFVSRADSGAEDPGRDSQGGFILRRDIELPHVAEISVKGQERDLYYRYVRAEPPDELVPEDPDDLYDAAGDESEEEETQSAFWPVPPAEELEIEIRFDVDMEEGAENEAFLLDGQPIEGEWRNDRTWRGQLMTPEGGDYESLRGYRALSIAAQTTAGAWIDGDPQAGGYQPDTDHRLLVDLVPVFVERVEARGGGRTIYDASWRGGPDLDDADDLTIAAIGTPERRLDVATAREAPAEGTGQIRLTLSDDTDTAPGVRVGGAIAVMEGEGRRWTGRFDFAEASREKDENGDLPVRITLDGIARQDADPRTVPVVTDAADLIGQGVNWQGLESERGGQSVMGGGPDVWHKIGPAPAMSLMIVLDASGSMEDSNRIANAKAGINQTLASLPTDRTVEVGVVVFTDCGSFNTLNFTRNIDQVRAMIDGVSPAGGTPLAGAHLRARDMFGSSADPRAREWRFASFTDGAETCSGNVIGATRALQSIIDAHRTPERDPPEPPAPPQQPRSIAQCFPDSWRLYDVKVEGGGSSLDQISLIEHSFIERALPDGRCLAYHQTGTYGVYYGSMRGGDARWGVNSQPSETETDVGRSTAGEADLRRVREAARSAANGLGDLNAARARIETAVQAALGDDG